MLSAADSFEVRILLHLIRKFVVVAAVVVVVFVVHNNRLERLSEVSGVAQSTVSQPHAVHDAVVTAEESRQAAAVFGKGMLLTRGDDDAGVEHDVEEGVVDSDHALCPGEEGGR